MKSQDIKQILQSIIVIMDLYPKENLNEILKDIKRLKENESKKDRYITHYPKDANIEHKNEDADTKAGIDEIISKIDSMSIKELEEQLNSQELFPSMGHIRYFSERIGINLTPRQSRVNAIHSIKSHVDRTRINKTISKRND